MLLLETTWLCIFTKSFQKVATWTKSLAKDLFWQKICESKVLLALAKEITKYIVDLTKKISVRVNFCIFPLHYICVTQCGNCAKSLSPTDFSVKSFFGKNQIPLLKECFSHIWIGTYEWHPLHIDCRWRYNLSIKVGFIHLCFFS